MKKQINKQEVYDYLTGIPKGKVVTYGQIATYLGNKNLARTVGNVLHENPDGEKYPCYKVVNAKGMLAVNYAFGGLESQKKKLEADGIFVDGNRVNLDLFQWHSMNGDVIFELFETHLQRIPQNVQRCAVGIANQVYIVECGNEKYIFRCSEEQNAYVDTIHWLTKLAVLDIPIPKVLFHGTYGTYSYLGLNYIEGEDIGLVYEKLTKAEKQRIAKDVMEIQRKVSSLQIKHDKDAWCWNAVVNELLDRAELRITQNGYFDAAKVTRLKESIYLLEKYFSNIKPVPYLDDISTKNLLIHEGRVSGVIDIDWMGEGDNLTFIAMTYIALRNMDCETDYVDYLLAERGCNDLERKAFLFYSLMYCVDFMGERGMQFGDKKIEVNEQVIHRLNQIYDDLWEEFTNESSSI